MRPQPKRVRAMPRKTKRNPEEEKSSYSWMDTYGDMVTLLLCFFVLLFSFSTIDAEKWKSLVGAFSGNTVASISALDPRTVTEPAVTAIEGVQVRKEDETKEDENDSEADRTKFMELYFKIKAYIEENGLNAELAVEKNGELILLTFLDRILFNSGKADILNESRPIMNEVIQLLTENIDSVAMIRIEGHTDNVPIHTAEFDSNWELSITRSINVLRYFDNSGSIDSRKLSAAGYGEFHPVRSNETPEGRARNRRVDFIIESIHY